jgi:hypothetical protein
MLGREPALARPKDVKLYKENELISVGNHSYSHANNRHDLYYFTLSFYISIIVNTYFFLFFTTEMNFILMFIVFLSFLHKAILCVEITRSREGFVTLPKARL